MLDSGLQFGSQGRREGPRESAVRNLAMDGVDLEYREECTNRVEYSIKQSQIGQRSIVSSR